MEQHANRSLYYDTHAVFIATDIYSDPYQSIFPDSGQDLIEDEARTKSVTSDMW